MLDDMESGDGSYAVRRKAPQILDCITLNDLQSDLSAICQRDLVQVHAAPMQAMLLQQLQPFASPAAHVDHRLVRDADSRFEQFRQIDADALLDVLPLA